MKTCGFENQIGLYLDGELSGAKLRSFEAHLQECPLCREEVEQFRGLLDGLKGMEEREVPPMLQERLHAALVEEAGKGAGRVKRKFNPWVLAASAAAVVVCLAGGALLAGAGGLFLSQDKGQIGGIAMDNAEAQPQSQFSGAGAASNGLTMEKPNAAPEPTPAATMAPSASYRMREGVQAPAAATSDEDKGGWAAADTAGSAGTALDSMAKSGDGRKIIYTASLVVETREYAKCMDTIDGVLSKYGGYRENSQENGVPDDSKETTGRTAVVSIRMPIGQYDAAMGELQAMGNVLSKNESTEDVSRQYVDTEARNKTLTMQRDKLYELLAKADSMENIIALQNEISRLTVEIEQMTAQLRFWDDKVSYSTITVELHELVTPKTVKPVDPDLGTRMNGALNGTLNDMKKGLEDFTVDFVGFLPYLAIIVAVAGIVTAVVVPLARRARKASKSRGASEKKKEE